jgi:hypothetical protein
MLKHISVLVIVVVGVVLGAIPLPAAEVLTPQEAGKKEPGTSIVVEMRIKSVVPYPDGYIRLFSEERFDDEMNFIVVLSPEAVQRLNRQRIDDIEKHFVDRVIRAKGKLERVIMSSKPITRPGVFVSDPANIETAPETKPQKPFRVYFVGNSVTDTINYGALTELAKSRGHEQVWGRHMIPGAPLQWIWQHPKDGFQEPPFGYYPNALTNYEWDILSLQPFDRLLDGDDGDLAMAKNFIDLALQKSPDLQIYVYARWPRLGKDDFDIAWKKLYTGGWDGTNETKDYFERLTVKLRKAYPNLKKPILMVPVGHVLYELNQQMKAGNVPGYKHVKELYADGIHLNNVGSYIVGCTYFATLYRENPKGLASAPYGVDDAKLAGIIQDTVWKVVSTVELSGCNSVANASSTHTIEATLEPSEKRGRLKIKIKNNGREAISFLDVREGGTTCDEFWSVEVRLASGKTLKPMMFYQPYYPAFKTSIEAGRTYEREIRPGAYVEPYHPQADEQGTVIIHYLAKDPEKWKGKLSSPYPIFSTEPLKVKLSDYLSR